MSNRKNQNSILVLATLGVYLGLVLVGATPQILAQNAVTAKAIEEYQIRFAKENKDEFDKPLDDNNLIIPQLIQLVSRLNAIPGFNWNSKTHYEIEELAFCGSDKSPAYMSYGSITDELHNVFGDFAVHFAREVGKRKVAKGFGDFYSQNVSYDFLIDNSTFSIKTTIPAKTDPERQFLINEFSVHLKQYSTNSAPPRAKIIFDNTNIESINDQIFIVTRLPRAGLDSLLAKDAK